MVALLCHLPDSTECNAVRPNDAIAACPDCSYAATREDAMADFKARWMK
jgi:hypothetical protein